MMHDLLEAILVLRLSIYTVVMMVTVLGVVSYSCIFLSNFLLRLFICVFPDFRNTCPSLSSATGQANTQITKHSLWIVLLVA